MEGKAEYREEFDAAVAQTTETARAGDLTGAISSVLKVEKKARLANEWDVAREAAVFIVKLAKESGDWEALNSNLLVLAKRRAQHQKVVTAFVAEALTYLSGSLARQDRLQLIETLREVTEGKIYVELERARLTKMLAEMKEAEGDLSGAASVLQEVSVETIGSMGKHEKADFVLEQMRLTLAISDYVRTNILSNKVDRKVLQAEDIQEQKLRFYRLMIQYDVHEGGPDELWRHFQAIFDTPQVQADEAQWKPALAHLVLFLALTEHDIEPATALETLRADHAKKLDQMPALKEVVTALTTQEVAAWPLTHEAEIRTHAVFSDTSAWGAACVGWWELLHRRVVEHNIRTVAKYYSRVRVSHLAGMLGLDASAVERRVADMVTGQQKLYARIDRPAGIISFVPPKTVDEVLNDWSADIDKVIRLVEQTDHLIAKEEQVQSATQA